LVQGMVSSVALGGVTSGGHAIILHLVSLPDHFPSVSHDRTRDPVSPYPWLQEIDAWDPK